jgi:nicotinamide-nucleotide amidase
MMENQVIPLLAEKGNNRNVVHRTVLTHGVGESFLTEMIRDWEDNLPKNIKLAYLPQPGIVRLRLTGTGNDRAALADQINQEIKALQRIIPDIVFGYERDTLEQVTGKLLLSKNQTLSTAESCTGGYLSHLVTSVPGSSKYYIGSIISYSNEMKQQLLGVSHKTLVNYGAVSEQTVIEMARGARKKFGTTYALSVSGIAGPDGGTVEKPVGLVWIALAYPQGTITKKFMFGEHRGRNIRRSALAALNMLRLHLIP